MLLSIVGPDTHAAKCGKPRSHPRKPANGIGNSPTARQPPITLARAPTVTRQIRRPAQAGPCSVTSPTEPKAHRPGLRKRETEQPSADGQTAQSGYLQQSRSTRSDSPTLVLWNATSHLAGSGETAGMSPSRSRGGRCSFPLTGVTGSCPPPPLLLVRPGSVVAASRPSLPTPAFSWQASPGARSLRHERTRQRERGRTIAFAHKRASASAAPDDRFRAPGDPRLASAWAASR